MVLWTETLPIASPRILAGRLNNLVVIFGCRVLPKPHNKPRRGHFREIFTYNLRTEQWRKYAMSRSRPAPPETTRACVLTFGDILYMFGGETRRQGNYVNSVWKLTKNKHGRLIWEKIKAQAQHLCPSPRKYHSGWVYEDKLWFFGGQGVPLDGYLEYDGQTMDAYDGGVHNHQLLRFCPQTNTWENMQCSGYQPWPIMFQRAARVGDNVWVYTNYDTMFRLNLPTLQWSRIPLSSTLPGTPGIRTLYTFTPVNQRNILLHSGFGMHPDGVAMYTGKYDSWLFDLESLTWTQLPFDKHPDCQWWDHVSVPGEEPDTVIIVGKGDEKYFSYNVPHCSVFPISIHPTPLVKQVKSLQDMTLQVIDKNREELPWRVLPKKLQEVLVLPGEENITAQENSNRKRLRPRDQN